MYSSKYSNLLLDQLVQKLELEDYTYESAVARYKNLSEWLTRKDSTVLSYSPHIFSQGSFRLGTAIKPLTKIQEYDLDIACKFCKGITKNIYTQKDVKKLLYFELNAYKKAYGIKKEVAEKQRCWRLEYVDNIKFHIDIVPCIPTGDSQKELIERSLLNSSETSSIKTEVVGLAIDITDNKSRNYSVISDDWNLSNPEGYALWFESRMKLAEDFFAIKKEHLRSKKIDELPTYKWKTPLQRSIQLLKRHRDHMFKNENLSRSKPISIILTTLAARAYQGESDLKTAVLNILDRMEGLVSETKPKVSNPVRPEEDFTDKWDTEEGKKLELEKQFYLWLAQARKDFHNLFSIERSASELSTEITRIFSLNISADYLDDNIPSHPSEKKITIITGNQSIPWRCY